MQVPEGYFSLTLMPAQYQVRRDTRAAWCKVHKVSPLLSTLKKSELIACHTFADKTTWSTDLMNSCITFDPK